MTREGLCSLMKELKPQNLLALEFFPLRDDKRIASGIIWVTTVRETQNRRLCRAFPIMFYTLPNIFRKESRYFRQYLNKFPFMVIVSNFEQITRSPTNPKVPNLRSDFAVSNFARFNFLNKPPSTILISTMSFILQN